MIEYMNKIISGEESGDLAFSHANTIAEAAARAKLKAENLQQTNFGSN